MGTTLDKTTSCADLAAQEPVEGNYFVAAYPPFSCWRADLVPEAERALAGPPGACPLGLYVHVPFCAHRCQYCYYLAFAGHSAAQIDDYVAALLQELALVRSQPAIAGRPLAFAYFGGGTPSLLPVAGLRRLLGGLCALFPLESAEEVTFECAPRSVTREKLALLHAAGVNRLSLGVQQLDDDVLRRNGRIHLVADVAEAWEAIREIPFDEVNIDLIVGLVGESDASFFQSLERVLQMAPESITIYQLEIPRNTPLARKLRDSPGTEELPSWEIKRARLHEAFARLEESGYRLRSAYAAARGSRHRRFAYQEEQYRGCDLAGVGTSALSYVGGVHYQNLPSQGAYLAAVREERLPLARAYRLHEMEQMTREFVLQLKLGRVETGWFHGKYGIDVRSHFQEPLERLERQGWLLQDAEAVTLTRSGLLRVDRLLAAFYLPEHLGLCYW